MHVQYLVVTTLQRRGESELAEMLEAITPAGGRALALPLDVRDAGRSRVGG